MSVHTMFSQIAEQSRHQLTSWFMKVQSKTKHKTADIKLERIITKPWDIVKTRLEHFYQQTLEFYQISGQHVTTLEDIEEHLKSYKQHDVLKQDEAEISIQEAKLLILTQACIGLNEIVFNRIVEIAADVDDQVEQWTKVQDQHIWLLLEKTPWYWFKYFFGSIQILTSETSTTITGMDHPKIEAAKKRAALRSLEEHLLIFLGVGNKVLSCFEYSSQLEEEQSRSQQLHILMYLSQRIMEHFFDLNNMEEEEKPKNNSPRDILSPRKTAKKMKEEVPSNLFQIPPDVLEGNTDRIYAMLEKNLQKAVDFEQSTLKILEENSRPTFLSSNWFQITVGTAILYGTASYIYNRQDVIVDLFQDAYVSVVNFLVRYVQEPVVAIYKTIRYENTLTVIDPKAMESEVDSLVNMVTDFVKKVQPTLTPQQLATVQEQAKVGDLSRILPHYEAAIQDPIKESVFGDLIQMLLIQVQKERVEISRAMFALDKLLKTNELNFEALGMIPAVIAGIAGIQLTSHYIVGRMSRPTLYRQIRLQIRNIERLLTANIETIVHLNKAVEEQQQEIQNESNQEDGGLVAAIRNNDMSFENLGRLMIHLNILKKYAQGLQSKYRTLFLEDIHDLEQFNNVKRVATITRMFHFYPFLVPQ